MPNSRITQSRPNESIGFSDQVAARAAADALVDAYVAWREACARVHAAHRRWSECSDTYGSLAFAAYMATLKHEEHAARVYQRRIEHVRRLACETSGREPRRAMR